MLVDTHTHLNFTAYQDDWQDVVDQAVQQQVKRMVVVGTDISSSQKAVTMSQAHPALYASVGIHPHHAKQYFQMSPSDQSTQIDQDLDTIKLLAHQPKVIAIGEVGLDQHHYKSSKYQSEYTPQQWQDILTLQQQLLIQQVKLAQSISLPLIIHSRQLKDQVLTTILKAAGQQPITGVFHCFEGSKKYAQRILDAGFYISFTGNITYLPERQAVADTIPLDKLLLETDSPYMTPEPKRKTRNQPSNVTIIASSHARSRGISPKKVINTTTENAHKLFGFN